MRVCVDGWVFSGILDRGSEAKIQDTLQRAYFHTTMCIIRYIFDKKPWVTANRYVMHSVDLHFDMMHQSLS